MPTIYIVNQSTLIDNAAVAAMVPALQEQVTRDFAPLWGISATVQTAESEPAGEYSILLMDSCGNPDDLGFHLDDNNSPTSKVGVGDAQRYNVPVSSVVSHELLEMLVDPLTTRMVDNKYIVEVCDPVSSDYYDIGGVKVANFVTPRYFGYNSVGQFDQLGYLQAGVPTLRAGGMIMFWNGEFWANTFGRHIDSGALPWRAHFIGRTAYRAKAEPELTLK